MKEHIKGASPTPYHLNDLVRSLRDDLSPYLHAGIEARIDLTTEELRIMVDPDEMREAILSLVAASVEALPQGSALTFTTKKIPMGQVPSEEGRPSSSGSCALFRMSVSARLMDEETGDREAGTGSTPPMGVDSPLLGRAFRIIRAHLGSINVERSSAQDTRVSIFLPLLKERLDVAVTAGPESNVHRYNTLAV
jgi:hypothetical protein